MKVPFVDLHAQYRAHKEGIDKAISDVIEATAFIGGQYVKTFERDFAAKYGVEHCIACANGTDAIYILLHCLGVAVGDEVITTAASWISTSETISQCGATPKFVDVDDSFNIDTRGLIDAFTPRTRAVIPVHLYGQAARVEEIAALAAERGVFLVEDCAQAHFAERRGRRVGTFGIGATFSFYPGKNLGAYGDAGCIITNDGELARKCRIYANHGALIKHQHEIEGVNSRLDGLQAAILSYKLQHIDAWTVRRRNIAATYDALLSGIPHVETPKVVAGSSHVYHLYVVKAERRDQLKDYLASKGIETAIHYPTALPLLPAYARFDYRADDFPVAAANQSKILSLPIYPEMTKDMIEYVASSVRTFYAS